MNFNLLKVLLFNSSNMYVNFPILVILSYVIYLENTWKQITNLDKIGNSKIPYCRSELNRSK